MSRLRPTGHDHKAWRAILSTARKRAEHESVCNLTESDEERGNLRKPPDESLPSNERHRVSDSMSHTTSTPPPNVPIPNPVPVALDPVVVELQHVVTDRLRLRLLSLQQREVHPPSHKIAIHGSHRSNSHHNATGGGHLFHASMCNGPTYVNL